MSDQRPDPTAPWGVFFRDDQLTDERALQLIHEVADTIIDTALACRLKLLEAGFADQHPQCVDLDAYAESWAHIRTICRSALESTTKEQNDERTTE